MAAETQREQSVVGWLLTLLRLYLETLLKNTNLSPKPTRTNLRTDA